MTKEAKYRRSLSIQFFIWLTGKTLLLHPFPCPPICLVKFLGVHGSWVLVLLNFPHPWELPMVMALSPVQPQDQPCTLILHPHHGKEIPKAGWLWWQSRIYPSVLFSYLMELSSHPQHSHPDQIHAACCNSCRITCSATAPLPKHPLCCSEGAGIGGCSALAKVKKADIPMQNAIDTGLRVQRKESKINHGPRK